MNTATFTIQGGDYAGGGNASKQVKEMLKRIGVAPQTVRRSMIAAYEAEMNVVIHARSGRMQVALDSDQLDVVITDEGPGIPDIELALTEGYSTAPSAARELGFGAGMGLPNIRRNADRFTIQSTVGEGTQIRFTIWLRPEEAAAGEPNSVAVEADRCVQCLQCLRACPTAAVRVRDGEPCVLGHLCVDCTSCISSCGSEALAFRCAMDWPAPEADTVLVLPAAFLEQFGPGLGPAQVLEGLGALGFRTVRLLEEWEAALRRATAQYAGEAGRARPVLTPMCPAVVNLIQMRFPSLLGHLAPYLTPVEAAREEITASRAVFLGLCPSHRTLLRAHSLLTRVEVVAPAALLAAVFAARADLAAPAAESRSDFDPPEALQVSGMPHVMRVLDEIENGLMEDYPVVELYACDQGCFGSPVWKEDPFVTRPRWLREAGLLPCGARPVRRTAPACARAGLRLDADMGKAIEKLARMDALAKALPGRNCGVCGAPTCAALAEDVVMGRAPLSACIYRNKQSGSGAG